MDLDYQTVPILLGSKINGAIQTYFDPNFAKNQYLICLDCMLDYCKNIGEQSCQSPSEEQLMNLKKERYHVDNFPVCCNHKQAGEIVKSQAIQRNLLR